MTSNWRRRFALLGVTTGWLGLTASGAAQAAEIATEAETWRVPTGAYVLPDVNASGGKALALVSNTRAEGPVSLQSPGTGLRLRVKATQCSGAPRAILSVDGTRLAAWDVTTTGYSTFAVDAALTAGAHRVSVDFKNDFRTTTCDRNVYVDKVGAVTSDATAPAPSPIPTPSPTPAPAPSRHLRGTFSTSPRPEATRTTAVAPRPPGGRLPRPPAPRSRPAPRCCSNEVARTRARSRSPSPG